jgi:glycosyltransferase involved in cell wall biosynthesis
MQALRGVRVGHLGHFDPDYPRNRIIAKALRRAGATVVTMSDQRRFLRRTPRLAARAFAADCDVIWIAYPGHSDVPVAKAVSALRRAPTIFDAVVSFWDSAVNERRTASPRSLPACRHALTERVACRLADAVVLDTATHLDFWADRFGVPRAKCHRIWLGADDDVMRPLPRVRADDSFSVLFSGGLLALSGLETVLHAAAILERAGREIRFVVVGNGPGQQLARKLIADLSLTSTTLLGSRDYEELPQLIAESDLCLGTFGTSPKAARAIPNKVFEAIACRRPVVTADTRAARELFSPGEDILVCRAGDSAGLATLIADMHEDPLARERIATRAHDLFRRELSIEANSRAVAAVVTAVLTGDRRTWSPLT